MNNHTQKCCTHIKHLTKDILKTISTIELQPECLKHILPLYYLCLHCGQSICLQHQEEGSCLEMHRKINPNHLFAVQMEHGSIWCGQCRQTIQNMIFSFHGEDTDENYQKMKRFQIYLKQIWKQLTSKMQLKVGLISHKGIINLGNTCYLNSVLQSLFASKKLKELYQSYEVDSNQAKISYNKRFILKQIQYYYDDIITKKESQSWTIVQSKKTRINSQNRKFQTHSIKNAIFNVQIRHFFMQMDKDSHRPFNPQRILNYLCNINKKYELKQQQDADQLLHLIIDVLSEGQKFCLLDDTQRYNQIEGLLGYQKLAPVQSLFGFYLMNQIQCNQCKTINSSLNLTYNICLSLDHPSNSKETYQMFHKEGKIKIDYWEELYYPQKTQIEPFLYPYFKVERLNKSHNYYECAKCKSILAFRRYYIISEPQILIVTVKRFNSKLQKQNAHIPFPYELNLNGISVNQSLHQYRLYAVIVHEGKTLSSGHYLSFIRLGNEWVLCSDQKIQVVDWKQVQSQQAYILLYQKIGQQ